MTDRVLVSFSGLAEFRAAKLMLASAGAVAVAVLEYLASLYGSILHSDPVLVGAIVLLLVVDLVTGVAAAVRRGERVTSRAFRRTGRKVLEYTALGLVGVALANGFQGSPLAFVTAALDDAVLLYIALTEALSVFENVTGSRERAVALFRRIVAIRSAAQGQDGAGAAEAVVEPPSAHPGETPPAIPGEI